MKAGTPLSGGSYYLSGDVEYTGTESITVSGEVILCLNGQVLDLKGQHISVGSGASLTLCDCSTGGVLTGGSGGKGGGVYVDGGGTFTLSGGSITGNATNDETDGYGGGVCLYGTFYLSGDPIIQDNTKAGTADNLYLGWQTINITGPLGKNAHIGVTAENVPRTFISGWSNNMAGENPADYFSSDGDAWGIGLNTAWDAVLGSLCTTITLNPNGGTLSEFSLVEGAALPIPSKTGYTFAGWYENPEFSGNPVTDIPTDSTGNLNFYAKWTANIYTVTVQTDGNGTASASPATASAGTTVTLAADPDSGYHFERWEIVSGTVTISGSQFTMPAEHVTVKAVFDRNSSGGGSSGGSNSYREREYDFWMEVKDKIEDADPGDTIRVNARSYDRMPWSVMEALRNADGVTLHITWNGGEDILIPSAAALSEQSRVYYPLSYLEDIDFTVEPEAPAYDTNKVNPGTGGILEVTAPAAAGSITAPAGQPEITDPQRGLAETPELAEKGIEQPLPGIYEPEEAVAATTDSTSPETGFSAIWIAVIAALAVTAGGGVWFWKRRSAE